MASSPAFQFYPADFVIDTGILTPTQVGVYILLLCSAWKGVQDIPKCHLPDDDESLAAIGRVSLDDWLAMRKRILPYFRKDGELLAHDRLIKELKKQEQWAAKSSEGGKKSAATKAERKGGSRVVQPPNQPNANSSVFSLQSSPSGKVVNKPSAVGDSRGQQRQQPLDGLVAYLGEMCRHDVQAVAEMPGAGTQWARGFFATWGPNGSMEGNRIPADVRAEVVGVALRRFVTDRQQWSSPGFAPFVDKAYADLLEHRAAQAKAEDAKASAAEREDWKAREAAEIERLNAEARERGFDAPPDPESAVRLLADKFNLRAQGSRT